MGTIEKHRRHVSLAVRHEFGRFIDGVGKREISSVRVAPFSDAVVLKSKRILLRSVKPEHDGLLRRIFAVSSLAENERPLFHSGVSGMFRRRRKRKRPGSGLNVIFSAERAAAGEIAVKPGNIAKRNRSSRTLNATVADDNVVDGFVRSVGKAQCRALLNLDRSRAERS